MADMFYGRCYLVIRHAAQTGKQRDLSVFCSRFRITIVFIAVFSIFTGDSIVNVPDRSSDKDLLAGFLMKTKSVPAGTLFVRFLKEAKSAYFSC